MQKTWQICVLCLLLSTPVGAQQQTSGYSFQKKTRSGKQLQTTKTNKQSGQQAKDWYLAWSTGGVLLLLVFAGLYYRKRQKHHKLMVANHKLRQKEEEIAQQLKAEEDKYTARETWHQAEREALAQELALKNQQLAAHSLQIIEKNQLLQQIHQSVQQARQKQSLNEAKAIFKKLVRQIDQGIKLDKDWEQFRNLFEQIHPGFYAALKQQHPSLSPGDLHYCALLKINLPPDTIASLLGIASTSLRVKHTRLRKKMGIASDKGLTDFVIGFEVG